MVGLALRVLPAELEAQAARIVQAMQHEVERCGATGSTPNIDLSAVQFTRRTDPYNQLPGYEGVWRDERHARCGSITFNSDGSFYAEYDLFYPHPGDARWLVEMVTAWGAGELLCCETRMIPAMDRD